MGRESEYFKVSSLRLLQALTIPRALLSVSNRQPIRAPFPHRERGWGERANALRLLWERICAQYGLNFGSRRNSIRIQHCKRQKGVRQGGTCPP